jgi:hypothetical protein
MNELLQAADVMCNGDFMNFSTHSGYHLCTCDFDGANIFLSMNSTDSDIGNVCKNALALSRHMSLEEDERIFTDEKVKKFWKNWDQTTKKKYAYKNVSELLKTMMRVSIKKYEDIFLIYPWKRLSKEGYMGADPDIKLPTTSSPEEIGAAVRRAFTHCTGLGAYEFHKKLKALGWEK